MGKAFEKQIKTSKDQGEKQVEALNTLKSDNKKLTIEKYPYDDEDTPFISKQKDVFNKLVDERLEKITDLHEKVNNNDLIYRYKGNTGDLNFDRFDNAISLIDKIRDGKISLTDVKNNQWKLKSCLEGNKKGGKKSKEQKNTLYNIEMLYKARNEAIKLYDDYSLMMSEAKVKAAKGLGLKILTSKQMLQRFSIALEQVKAGSNSENLSNEIRQIVYSLYQSKEITKKVYNNLIKSL